jgi:hypothetical protein
MLGGYKVDIRPHFDDLRRRYREADWVSEYQRLWAIFNHWFFAHTGERTDRRCLESLKESPELSLWIDNVIQASAYNYPHSISDGYGGSYPRFAADNVISLFFRASQASPTLEPRINWPWRHGTNQLVHQTHALTLTREQFRNAYDAHHRALASDAGVVFDETLHQVLPALGIGATGCCFYRVASPASISPETRALAELTLQELRTEGTLSDLVSLIDSSSPTVLGADVIETLYNLRNLAVHGPLDFLQAQDNAVARAGYDLLDSLIINVRDGW